MSLYACNHLTIVCLKVDLEGRVSVSVFGDITDIMFMLVSSGSGSGVLTIGTSVFATESMKF